MRVADPTKKARDADRDAAIEVVEAAYADGQITQADSELRVGRLLQARTIGDVEVLVRDLQGAAGGPGVSRLTSFAPQPPGRHQPPAGRGVPKVVWVIVAVFLVFAAVSVAVPLVVLSSVEGGVVDSAEVAGPDLMSHEGYESFVAAVDEKTGSSTVYGATIYPGYAIVEVPVGGRSQRSVSYYYDGDWEDWGGSGTAMTDRFDLIDLDGRALKALVGQVQVEDPDTWYALVNSPGRGKRVCVSVYASNEYDESSYVDATCDGDVVFTPQG